MVPSLVERDLNLPALREGAEINAFGSVEKFEESLG
jgi:hypothetical protein